MIKVDALLRRYYILDCIDPQIYHYGDYFYTYSSYCNVVEGKFIHKTIPDVDADDFFFGPTGDRETTYNDYYYGY